MTTGLLKRFTNLFYGEVAEGNSKNSDSKVIDDGGLNSTVSPTAPTEDTGFEIIDFPHLGSADKNGYDIVDVSSLPVAEKTVNNEDVPTLGPVEESDIDKFEIIEDTNPPDQKERSIPASNYKINESVAEIAGFNKEKLLEMCTFSKMTYGNDDEKLSKAGYKTQREFREEGYTITPFLDSKGREAGLVFTRGKEVTIAYRGTQGYDDIITDINASFTVPSFLLEGGRVHRGFYNASESSFADLEYVLESHAKAQKLEIKDLKINLTGHSMGGALAKLAALCLKKTKGAQDIHVATFGDPRVFDLTASEIYNEVLGENTIRVTQHRQDAVPAVPHGCTGYAHVGAQLRVEKSPDHFVHQIDGYYKGIHNVEEGSFKSNNNVSLFYYPVRLLNILNCAVLGSAQRAIVKFSGYEYSSPTEQKWYQEAMSHKETNEWYQVSHEEAKEQTNTEISLSRVNQVAKESRVLQYLQK